jgi:hypothetical protein
MKLRMTEVFSLFEEEMTIFIVTDPNDKGASVADD